MRGVTDSEKKASEKLHPEGGRKLYETVANITLTSKSLFDVDSQGLKLQ